MRIVAVLLAVVVGLGLLVVIVGYLLPVKHEASVSAQVPAAPWCAFVSLHRIEGQTDEFARFGPLCGPK